MSAVANKLVLYSKFKGSFTTEHDPVSENQKTKQNTKYVGENRYGALPALCTLSKLGLFVCFP